MRNIKCPNCGGMLEIMDEETGKVKCPYCDYVGSTDDYKETHVYTDTAKVEEAKNERYKYERMFDHLERQEAAKEAAAKKKTKMILVGIVGAVVVAIGAFLFHTISHKNDLQINVASSELIGANANDAARIIKESGLSNIENVEIQDLTNKDAALEYLVTRVSINGTDSFKEKAWFPKDSKVMVEYHLLDPNRPDEVKVPGSYSELIGKNYEDVQRSFEEAGFTNIILDPRADVSMISKDRGLVTEVYVDGRGDFDSNAWVEKSAKVRLVFHSTKGDEKDIAESKAAEEYEQANVGNILMPLAAKKYVGSNYGEVESAIRDLGFKNIELVPLGDIKKDILRQENKVDEISINGDAKFKEGVYFEPNAPVVIKYHSRTES